MIDIVKALLLTQVIEGTTVIGVKEKQPILLLVVLLVNCLTNPIMNFTLGMVPLSDYWFYLILFEITVFLFEASLLWLIFHSFKKALLTSFLMNGLSLLLGLLWMPLIY